jgi:hypothetical protein
LQRAHGTHLALRNKHAMRQYGQNYRYCINYLLACA